MSNLHRGHSIDASYQVSVHLAGFKGEDLKKSANQKQDILSRSVSKHGYHRNLVGIIYVTKSK
jgi:hypothetical protein